MGAASYVVGSHSFRGGADVEQRRLAPAEDVDRRHAADHLQRRPAGVGARCACRTIATTASSATSASTLQDRWSLGRITVNAGVRFDQFIGETRESTVLPSRHGAGATFGDCPDGQWDPGELCTGEVQNWKDISPRVGVAMDVFGNGRTAIKASWARYVAGQQIAFVNQVNPIGALTATDTRPWTDLDGNGLPLDANGNIQFNELAPSASTPTFGRLTVPTTHLLARRAARLGQARLQQRDHVRDAAPARRSHLGERRLLSPDLRQPDVHRRSALRREQLRLVLHHGADRSRSAGRRRLPGVRRAWTSSRRCSR